MTTLERLGADDLRAVVTGFRDALRAHQDAVNRLNVYPGPDGDTGTNMALTLESVVSELDGRRRHGVDVHGHQPRLAHGARGNSGVILSQILRGIAGSSPATRPEASTGQASQSALAAAAGGAYGAR
jgi:dihydroxyacetone kinase-like predicted kinase